jgi:hypothetical protein
MDPIRRDGERDPTDGVELPAELRIERDRRVQQETIAGETDDRHTRSDGEAVERLRSIDDPQVLGELCQRGERHHSEFQMSR